MPDRSVDTHIEWLSADESVCGNSERRQERFDARSDLVSDRTDRLNVVPHRIVEFPVFVAFAGIKRAG
jgi:hypothetical protein